MTLPLPRPVFDANSSAGGFGRLPEWDLSDLYAGPDAPEFAADMAWLEKACAESVGAPAVKAALAETVQELDIVLGGLDRLRENGGSSAAQTPPVDEAQLRAKLAALAKLLAESDAQATALAAEISAMVGGSDWQSRFAPVADAVESFDFDIAAEKLRGLR